MFTAFSQSRPNSVVDVIKLFFGENQENLDFPLNQNSKNSHFKSN